MSIFDFLGSAGGAGSILGIAGHAVGMGLQYLQHRGQQQQDERVAAVRAAAEVAKAAQATTAAEIKVAPKIIIEVRMITRIAFAAVLVAGAVFLEPRNDEIQNALILWSGMAVAWLFGALYIPAK